MVDVPLKSHGKLTWQEAINRCQNISGRPFIPKDKTEFKWMEEQHTAGGFNVGSGQTMWFPATDSVLEGNLIFTDWKGLEIHGDAVIWRNNMVMEANSEEYDCVGFRTGQNAYMWDCNSNRYPMICEKN
ncbi:unnamed protein product, partial [Meganyctiphanes norvegica]